MGLQLNGLSSVLHTLTFKMNVNNYFATVLVENVVFWNLINFLTFEF